MVFQFEHVAWTTGRRSGTSTPCGCATSRPPSGAGSRAGRRGLNSLYWDNHDQPRAVSRFGDDSPRFRRDSATCLATLLHLHRGTPYVYQGQELGMANFPFRSLEEFADVESLNHHVHAVSAGHDPGEVLAALRTMSRDNARTPVQWDDSPNAGFTTGRPWLAVNPDHVEYLERGRASATTRRRCWPTTGG